MTDQYKVISFKRNIKAFKPFKSGYEPEVIEEALNRYYDEGWTVKKILAPNALNGNNIQLLVFLEKKK
jgi:hypothetical protein